MLMIKSERNKLMKRKIVCMHKNNTGPLLQIVWRDKRVDEAKKPLQQESNEALLIT